MIVAALLPSPTWVHQVGWTLVHSIWQIALIAAFYALIAVFLRNASANVRYVMGCAALLLMLAVPVGTFAWLSGQTQGGATSSKIAFLAQEDSKVGTESGSILFESNRNSQLQELAEKSLLPKPELEIRLPFADARKYFFTGWPDRIEPFLPWLCGSWLLGSLILSLRPLWGWFTVHRLQTQGRCSLSAKLQQRASQLIDRMAIRQAVEFTQSALVKTPSVVGHLRPVVLLPISAITGLTLEQLEMILAHELAHVQRHDYLVNVIQTIQESLLFFHPCVWWVSAQVRRERENCCDDVAIAVCGDRETYVRALFVLEQLNGRNMVPAVAANGGSLLNRIRRLLGSPASTEFTMKRNAAWLGGLLVVMAMSPLAGNLSYQVAVGAAFNGMSGESYAIPDSSSLLTPNQDEDPEVNFPDHIRKALAEVLRLGGSYQQQKNEDGTLQIVLIDLGRTAADDTTLEKIASLINIRTLTLSHTKISDVGLRYLQNMTNLWWLELGNTSIKGPGLAYLAGLEHLAVLRLSRTKVDDASIGHVVQMKALRNFWIEQTRVTQAGVRALWEVRPALKVVGADGLKLEDHATVKLMRSNIKKTSATQEIQTASHVVNAMQARDDRVQSFRFQWNELRHDRKGTLRSSAPSTRNLINFQSFLTGPTNREDIVYEAQITMLVSGRLMRFESDDFQPIVQADGEVRLVRQIYLSTFDGTKTRLLYQYPGSNKPSKAYQYLSAGNGDTNLAATAPLLSMFCTFDEQMVAVDWNHLEVLDEPCEIKGSRCFVLEQVVEPLSINSKKRPSQLWYVDPQRGYAIVRYESRLPDGQITKKTDITHKEDPQWGWLPLGWTIESRDLAGKVISTVEATVTQYEINPSLSSKAFELNSPENTHVNQN